MRGERWWFQPTQVRRRWGLQRCQQGSLVLARQTGERHPDRARRIAAVDQQGTRLYALDHVIVRTLLRSAGGEGPGLLEQLIPAGATLGGPGRLLGFLFLPWLRISHAGVDIRSGGDRHPVAPRVVHSGVVHHRQHVVERRHPPRSRRRHDAIAPRLSRPLRSAAARPATTSHERLISLCKSLNCNGQNQTAEKNSLHETPSWLLAS